MSTKQSELSGLFDQLYRENYAKVYRLAMGLTGNVHDSEEITQEAFLRAFRSFHTFRQESSFFTWIYRITLNVANDYLRHRTKLPIYELTEDRGYPLEKIIDPNPSNDPETQLLGYQARVKCLHCLTECLPVKQRRVFCLALTIGLRHQQIADILECSVSSVKTNLHRAKKRWFGYMEDKCQLINKANPCNCRQFVRFGLEQGWISKGASARPHPVITAQLGKEILRLQILRDLYKDLYLDTADESFARRIREGIRNKEWAVFS
jgi:RNA polymerase sigma-70 factor (ECF subfamily)